MSSDDESPPRLRAPPTRGTAPGVSTYTTPQASPVGCAYVAAACGSPNHVPGPKRRFPVLPVLSVCVVLSVLVGGSVTFMRLEQPGERARAREYRALRAALVDQFELMDFEHQALLQQYFDMTEIYLTTRATAPDDDHNNWNFMGSLYFCFTVITTIGYGTYTPNTETGRLFCIFYALVGIPCFVVMTTIISESILNTVRLVIKDCILEGVERGWLKTTPRFSISTLSLCALGLFVTFFVLSWAGAFSIYNGWSYLDSVYFGIVTVTTIGFGDMVPEGSQLVAVEHLLYMCYFVFGLISMGTLITAVQKKVVEVQQRHHKQNGGKDTRCDTPGTLQRMAYIQQLKTGQIYESSIRIQEQPRQGSEGSSGQAVDECYSESDYESTPPASTVGVTVDIELMATEQSTDAEEARS